MKKNKKTKLMAAILAAAAGLTGCDTGSDNIQTVYGPPQSEKSTTAPTSEYDPAKDNVQDVYGPPLTEETEEQTTEYEPSHDNVQLVYGPPKS